VPWCKQLGAVEAAIGSRTPSGRYRQRNQSIEAKAEQIEGNTGWVAFSEVVRATGTYRMRLTTAIARQAAPRGRVAHPRLLKREPG